MAPTVTNGGKGKLALDARAGRLDLIGDKATLYCAYRMDGDTLTLAIWSNATDRQAAPSTDLIRGVRGEATKWSGARLSSHLERRNKRTSSRPTPALGEASRMEVAFLILWILVMSLVAIWTLWLLAKIVRTVLFVVGCFFVIAALIVNHEMAQSSVSSGLQSWATALLVVLGLCFMVLALGLRSQHKVDELRARIQALEKARKREHPE
jgi:hypothetical protein